MTHRRHRGIGRAAAAAVALATAAGPAAPAATAAEAATAAQGGGPAQALTGRTLTGVWRTEGYGLVIAVSGGRLTTYDVTEHSCVPGWLTATQAGPP